jgi:hypothetical protein
MGKTSNQPDPEKTKTTMEKLVRAKAIKAGGDIFYLEGENIVSENPKTGSKKIVKKSSRKLQ